MTATLGRLWAVARLTLLEASRRKVFAILLLFAGALVSSVAFFPSVDMVGRLRLMEVWALRAATLFTAIVALFITGFSLPADFEQKRIYLLVSKPVAKSTIFLGRFVGLTILLAIFVGSMGAVTVVFIRGVQLFAGSSFPRLVAFERWEAKSFTALNEYPVEGEGDKKYITGGAVPQDWRPVAAREGLLVWRFEGIRRGDFDREIHIESRLAVGAPKDPYRASGTVALEAMSRTGRKELKEYLNTSEDREWLVPAELVGEDGILEVAVRCQDADGYIGAGKEGIALYLKPALFEPAFARGIGLVFLQSMTVLALTLMASSFLSAPLSILLGILLFLVGSAYSYVRDGTRDIDRSLKELKVDEHRHRITEEIPPWFLRFSSFVSNKVLLLVPDFDDFDFSRWLLKDRAVSWKDLGNAARHAFPTVVVLGILGMLVMIFKDFDR